MHDQATESGLAQTLRIQVMAKCETVIGSIRLKPQLAHPVTTGVEQVLELIGNGHGFQEIPELWLLIVG
jgi:hypothetical protein